HEPLRQRLVTEHLPVARNIAYRFRNRGEFEEDLTQVAAIGLLKAVDRFDPGHGADFMSFAVPTIVGEVRRYFRDSTWDVRVPRPLKERHASISTAAVRLSQELGRAPTPSEIAGRLGIAQDEVVEGLEAAAAQRSSSLDAILGQEDGDSLGGTLGAYDAELSGVDDRETLRPLLRELPERERTVLALRFFKNMTQTQIAERLGVSQMQISRLLARTLSQLRQSLGEA
ncbi:MAG: SigB/SigF/SigG family RNA polymerase sigma factor, partial [Sciscionella sp.]